MKGSEWSWSKRISVEHNKGYRSIPPKVKKYPCKKLKGKHDYQVDYAREWDFFWTDRISVYLKCVGCGKEQTEILKK